jgi:hypothetical protein
MIEFRTLAAASAWSAVRYGKRIPVSALREAVRRGELRARPVLNEHKVPCAWKVTFKDLDAWARERLARRVMRVAVRCDLKTNAGVRCAGASSARSRCRGCKRNYCGGHSGGRNACCECYQSEVEPHC